MKTDCRWESTLLFVAAALVIILTLATGCGSGNDGANGENGQSGTPDTSRLQGKIAYYTFEYPEDTDCHQYVDRSFKRHSNTSKKVDVYFDHYCNDFSGAVLDLTGNATFSVQEGLYLLQGSAAGGITLTHFCW